LETKIRQTFLHVESSDGLNAQTGVFRVMELGGISD